MLTVSHLYPSRAHPGWGPFVKDEVRELARRNRMAVVAPVPLRTSRRSREIRRGDFVPYASIENGIHVIRPRLPGIPVGGRLIEPALWARRLDPLLTRLYREMDGDVVHAHFALPDGYAAAYHTSRHSVPLVLTIRGSDVLVFGLRAISRRQLRWLFERAQAIVAVSNELAERANALGARGELIHVITGGVPFADREPPELAKDALGVEADFAYVLWVGNFVEAKQPLDAIRAFAEVVAGSAARPSRLVMIGDGPQRARAERLVNELELDGQVKFCGYLPRHEVWRWQCATDLQVSSSRSEGTPIAILEALGNGNPVAAYPVPGVQAVVEALQGGTIATERTPGALASAVAEVLAADHDRARLAQRAREQFDIARTGRAIEDVYEAVI